MRIYSKDDCLVISVQNNGKPVDVSHAVLIKKGMGLAKINDPLQNLYGKDYFFEIRNNLNSHGVETIIKIPFD